MASLVHQVVTIYKDDTGSMIGVCACGKAYPLDGSAPSEMSMASHISMGNRTEAADL